MIDSCVEQVYDLLKNKSDGIGIIRIIDNLNPIAEYYSSLDDIHKFDLSQNLCIVQAKDHIERATIRRVCLMRYNVMRNETKT